MFAQLCQLCTPGLRGAGIPSPWGCNPPLPPQLVQIIINTTHLEKSCRFLEEFITNITNVLPETVHTTKLYGTTTFKVGGPGVPPPLGGVC